MKRLWFTLFSLLAIATMTLTACGPKATPVATQVATEPPTQKPAEVAPTEAPTTPPQPAATLRNSARDSGILTTANSSADSPSLL